MRRYVYVCRRCNGPPQDKPPEGACPHCGGFYRHEAKHALEGEGGEVLPHKDGEPLSLADLMAGEDDPAELKRPTGSPGVDYIFDGGLPFFGVILFSAVAGIGKTTWLFMLLHLLAVKHGVRSLLAQTEQSESDLRRQFKRLDLKPTKDMIIVAEDDKDSIIQVIEKEEPEIVVVDSLHDVQNITDESGYDLASGQPTAVARVAKEIKKLSSEMEFLAFLVGHCNNDGSMAGGSHLRHTVDATLVLERLGADEDPRRVLRFEKKNRLGPPNRKALFRMGEKGMIDCGPIVEPGAPPPPRPEPASTPPVPHKPTGKKPRGVN